MCLQLLQGYLVGKSSSSSEPMAATSHSKRDSDALTPPVFPVFQKVARHTATPREINETMATTEHPTHGVVRKGTAKEHLFIGKQLQNAQRKQAAKYSVEWLERIDGPITVYPTLKLE